MVLSSVPLEQGDQQHRPQGLSGPFTMRWKLQEVNQV